MKKFNRRDGEDLQKRLKTLENKVEVLKQKIIHHNVRWVQREVDFRLLSRRMEKLEALLEKVE